MQYTNQQPLQTSIYLLAYWSTWSNPSTN